MMIKGIPKERIAFALLVAAGLVVCALTELEKISPAVQAICGGEGSGCETVQASSHSSLFGISLGWWGIASYLTLAGLYWRNPAWAGLYAGILMGAEFYFVYLQIFAIQAICILCMSQFTVVMLLALLLFATAFPAARRWRWRAAMLGIAAAAFATFFVPFKVQAAQIAGKVESITTFGNPASKYRIEVFSDYECPHCKHNEGNERRIMKEYPEIHFVFRDFIIPTHTYSPMAAAYAGSIAFFQGQDAYLKTRAELFANQENIFGYLKDRLPAMKQDKNMERVVNTKIAADRARAEQLQITGTPVMAMSKDGETVRIIRGFLPWDKLKPVLDEFTGRAAGK